MATSTPRNDSSDGRADRPPIARAAGLLSNGSSYSSVNTFSRLKASGANAMVDGLANTVPSSTTLVWRSRRVAASANRVPKQNSIGLATSTTTSCSNVTLSRITLDAATIGPKRPACLNFAPSNSACLLNSVSVNQGSLLNCAQSNLASPLNRADTNQASPLNRASVNLAGPRNSTALKSTSFPLNCA